MTMIRSILMRSASFQPYWAGEDEGTAAATALADAPAQTAATEPAADPATGEAVPSSDASQTAASVETQIEEAKAEPKSDWRDKRIAKLTAQLAAARQQPPAAPAGSEAAPLDPTADFNARVEQAANARAAAMEFNRQCDAAADRGRKEYGKDEFDGAVKTLVETFVDKNDPASVATYSNFLSAALEIGEAEKLLFTLGSNPNDLDEAERILSLPPLKMAVELTKLAQREPAEDVSAAPKPIRPIKEAPSSNSTIAPSDPTRQHHLSTAEWMKRREAEVAAQRRY